MCRLEGDVGVSGKDSNEDAEGLREESETCFYFANIFIYSHIKKERY